MLRHPAASPRIPRVISGLVTLFLLGVAVLMGVTARQRAVQNERIKAIGELATIRAGLEGALNARLLLGQGLVSYIAVKPDLSAAEFDDYSRRLVARDPMIRNITVLKGTTVTYAYPLRSNEKVIGVDLAQVPGQRESILKVLETGKPIVIPRVELIQGGVATISRLPVTLDGPDGGRYWGQVSIVLMQDVLFREAGLAGAASDLRCVLWAGQGHGNPPLFGDGSIRDESPVELEVKFPHGTWTLSAAPGRGWGYSDTLSLKYSLFGGLLSVGLGGLLFSVLRSRRRIDQLESFLPICASCKKLRNEDGSWSTVESYFGASSDIRFSHGLCPDCADKFRADVANMKK